MGTAALEGGARKLPTILLDLSYSDIPDSYEFRWLHETVGFNLAEEVSGKHLSKGEDSLGELLVGYMQDPGGLDSAVTTMCSVVMP